MNFKGLRVFITGGAGFIGSHIVDDLVRKGARVTVYDDFSSGLMENLGSVKQDIRVVCGDILDYAKLKRSMRGAQLVSHQAAQLEITKCIDDPIDDLRTNTVGSLNVLHAGTATGAEKIILASSACVYGQAQSIPQDEDRHPTNPNWAYGASKLATEKYARIYSESYGIPTVCLRYAIVYGPREWYGRVLTIFLKRALEDEPPVIFGKGRQLRDFTYVGDAAVMHNLCVRRNTGLHQVFNVSTGKATSVKQLAATVVAVTGTGLKPIHERVAPGERSALVDEQRMRLPSELEAMVLSPTKARRHLGWRAKVTLRQGLKAEYEWLQSHRDRWKKLSY